jgi:hypothetical protein
MQRNVPEVSRRAFLGAAVAASAAQAQPRAATAPDLRALISESDLIYERPVPRSEEGIPIGNGTMGTLVWTTPNELRFQINRVDVYANNSATNSFFERHNDYCGGCGFVEIDFGAFSEPFPESGFRQHLSVYDGLLTIEGAGVTARILAAPAYDVMAIEIDDRRRSSVPVEIHLRMLRSDNKYFGGEMENYIRDHEVVVQNRNHTAASQLLSRNNGIGLRQEFREGDYVCQSCIAIGVSGRDAISSFPNETEVRLSIPPGAGRYTVWISTTAGMHAGGDVTADGFEWLEGGISKGFGPLAAEAAAWWHDFWERGYVSLRSADGTAQFVQQNYHYFLYVMASSSRGKFPPKFNGMLWNTQGDLRTWGAQHWYANLSCYYEMLFAANRPELLQPVFSMYGGMYQAAATAAREEWGSQGIYIPETSFFDGLEQLPDDVATEMRDLYLLRKPWEQRSPRFQEFALTKHPHSSRWNWIQAGTWEKGHYVITDRGAGPYGPVNHSFASGPKVAYYFWRHYEFTLDRDFLSTHAYPMLKGVVEFYRNFPNVKKGADGKYHIHNVNSNESVLGARDTDEDLSAMRGVTAALLRAAQILNRDAEMQPVWREFLDHLAPLSTSDNPEALKPATYQGPRVFVRGLKPSVRGVGLTPDGNSMPMWLFDLCHVHTADRATLETANNTFNYAFRNGINANTNVQVLSKQAIAGALLGRPEAARFLVPAQIQVKAPERGTSYRNGAVLANRMTLREGPQALDAQRLGRAGEALQLALIQSNPPFPGEDSAIHLFPAWPKEWDARFRLAARGAFVVEASIQEGKISTVIVESQGGAECRMYNPWPESAVAVAREGGQAETLRGALLRFPTRKGERITLRSV